MSLLFALLFMGLDSSAQPSVEPTYELICKSSQNPNRGWLYDVFLDEFLEPDSSHEMHISDCNNIARVSMNGLTCLKGPKRGYAIYSLQERKYLDEWYSKSGQQCYETLKASTGRYTCLSQNRDGETWAALYDFKKQVWIDDYYNKSLKYCLQALR